MFTGNYPSFQLPLRQLSAQRGPILINPADVAALLLLSLPYLTSIIDIYVLRAQLPVRHLQQQHYATILLARYRYALPAYWYWYCTYILI
jgi:hypothetical protein